MRNLLILVFVCTCFFVSAQSFKSLEEMSLQEKVGQLFMSYFWGEEANKEIEELIRDYHVGGVIYYNWSNGLHSPLQVQTLSNSLQKIAIDSGHWPLFISVDQEGGLVGRFKEGFTEFPGNAALSRCQDPSLVQKVAYAMGLEMNAVGVNMNLAPVADVNMNPKNPVIGIRSFGDQVDDVATNVEESVIGFLRGGVIPVLKHFPGHGDVIVDSHKGLPIAEKSVREIEEFDLKPFVKSLGLSPAVMTGHILVPAYDEENCATLSPKIVKKVLRDQLGFHGLVLTDSLVMQGVLDQTQTVEEAAIRSFLAGHEILLIGGRALQNKSGDRGNLDEIKSVLNAFILAVREGRISEDDVNLAVKKILSWKRAMNLSARIERPISLIKEQVYTDFHRRLSTLVAKRSVEFVRGNLPELLSSEDLGIVAPKIIENEVKKALIQAGLEDATTFFYEGLNPLTEDYDKIRSAFFSKGTLLFFSYNSWKFSQQRCLFDKIKEGKKTIVVCVRDPQDDADFLDADLLIRTYSPTYISILTALDWLNARIFSLDISDEEVQEIGKKVWLNESGGREEYLTFWKDGEGFPSMGIGHFIWPQKSYKGTFSQGRFHEVLAFLEKKGAPPPEWLEDKGYSPWESREEFYQEIQSAKMLSLREYLKQTIPLQALYLKKRLDFAMVPLALGLSLKDRQNFINQYFRIADFEGGHFVLLDYLNFKHSGNAKLEKYHGEGWGLLQVLHYMKELDCSLSPIEAFVQSAKEMLIRRVKNSPEENLEIRWVPGWFNRLERYMSKT